MPFDATNYCTANTVLSNLSRTARQFADTDNPCRVFGTEMRSTGKWYFEAQIDEKSSVVPSGIGIAFPGGPPCGEFKSYRDQVFILSSGGLFELTGYRYMLTECQFFLGSVMMVAVDLDTGKLWLGRNNYWFKHWSGNQGDPAGGLYPTAEFPTGHVWVPMVGLGWETNTSYKYNQWTSRFSQNEQTFAAPSGFSAWDTDIPPYYRIVAQATSTDDGPSENAIFRSVQSEQGLALRALLIALEEAIASEWLSLSGEVPRDELQVYRDATATSRLAAGLAPGFRFLREASDGARGADGLPARLELGHAFAEGLGVSGGLTSRALQALALAARGRLAEGARLGFALPVAERAGLRGLFTLALGQVLAAALGAAPALSAGLRSERAAHGAVALAGGAGYGFGLLGADALRLAEDYALRFFLGETLADRAGGADQPLAAAGFLAIAAERLGAEEAPASLLGALEAVREAAALGGILRLPEGECLAWVVNSESLALSRYSGYPFQSFALFRGTYLGATDTGIYELEGEDDAGREIPAWIRTGLMDFGSSRQKALPAVYLGYTADGALGLKVVTTEGGRKTETWYRLSERKGAPDTARIPVGKGLRARYWGFELTNAAGADFALDHLHLYPVVLTRRI